MRKLFLLLTPGERRRIFPLIAAIMIMGLMQVAGVASMLPFLNIISDPSIVQENQWLGRLYLALGFDDPNAFLFFIGCLALVMLFLANACSAFTAWLMSSFSWSNQHRLSQRLLARYLSWPYIAYLTRNSADLRKNILVESAVFSNGVLLPAMKLLGYGFTTLFILAFLVWLNPLLALITMAVLGGAFALVYAAVRRRLDRAGRMRMEANTLRFKAAAEAFGGIKEAKVLGRESGFLAQFSAPARDFARTNTTKEVFSQVPRFALETLAFGGILLIVLILMAVEGDVRRIIPITGVYAFAAYRLMPALQNIYQSASTIRFNLVVIDTLHDHLTDEGPAEYTGSATHPGANPAAHDLPFAEAISLKNITFRYPNALEPALHGIDITIPRHRMVALVGPTGSGKTTLVDIVLGLLRPQAGALTVDGTVIDTTNLRRWQNMLGYVPQSIYLADDTVARNIAYGIPPQEINRAAVERAARIANLHDFVVGELPRGYDTVVGERGICLSGGQRQRVGLARALYHDPEVLILDEATSALDNETERLVLSEIERVGATRTVIMIAHRLTTVQHCDIIYVLEQGQVIARGTYTELMAGNSRFRRLARASFPESGSFVQVP